MRLVPHHHRLPRAGVDPIDTPELALRAITMAMQLPPRHETIVLFLDDARRGSTIVVVSGTVGPESIVDVVECLTHPAALEGRVGAIVVGTVRPGSGVDPADLDRWLEVSTIADGHGLELLEWFVLGAGVACPRDLLGESPRW